MKAFPRTGNESSTHVASQEGMELRDYFAAQALVALITRHDEHLGSQAIGNIVPWAYQIADMMMHARVHR